MARAAAAKIRQSQPFLVCALFKEGVTATTEYLVLEWMTPNPITATPRTTLPEANRIMKERRVRRLPVVEDGRVVGMVTSGDLREAAPSMATSLSVFELNYLLEKVTVDKIMKRHVITVTPKISIRGPQASCCTRKSAVCRCWMGTRLWASSPSLTSFACWCAI